MNAWGHSALPLIVMVPILAAAVAFLCPRMARWVALATVALVVLAVVALGVDVLAEGRLHHAIGGWGAPLGIELFADGLALLLVAVTAVIGAGVTVYAFTYFGAPAGRERHETAGPAVYFWPLWLALWAGLNALFLSGDLFNLYVTLELVGFAAVALVAVGGSREAVGAALRYLLVSLSGSLFFLLGVAILYGTHSVLDLAILSTRIDGGIADVAALALMTAGLLMKGALFPLHFWLPAAHASAPAPVSAALSALVVKGSFYILLRLWFEVAGGAASAAAMQLLGVLGAGAILWGSVQAMLQTRLKMLIAYSTVAQLGYLFLVFALADTTPVSRIAWQGGLLILAAHALAKSAMFLSAGNLMRVLGHDRIAELPAATGAARMSLFAFGLAGLSIVGLPPSGGFAGKWLLLTAAIEAGRWHWVIVTLGGSLLAAAYVLPCVRCAFLAGHGSTAAPPLPRSLELVALCLALTAATMGLIAWLPLELLDAERWLQVAGPAQGARS
jgi:formate hydrogenlyase subunit 3/multisubunit Na+/H+ antiporter MnhD subunit